MDTPGTTSIMLRLRELAQLFNSMDPSPFVERDLDGDAEEFITSWAREIPAGRELELTIQLSQSAPGNRAAGVEDAVRRYFASRATIKRLEFGQLMRRARLSLGVGTGFLIVCLFLAGVVGGGSPAAQILKEGLTIVGWVAMWRPLEIYLYEWWPLLEERRRLERLARIRVRVVMPTDEETGDEDQAEYEESAA